MYVTSRHLLLFLAVCALSTWLGVDPSRSVAQEAEAETEATEAKTPNDKASQQDLKQLQGEWTVVSAKHADIPEEFIKSIIGGTFTIKEKSMVMQVKQPTGEEVTHKTTIELDSSADPKQIVVTNAEDDEEMPDLPDLPGIYKLKGDRLHICLPTADVETTQNENTGEFEVKYKEIKQPTDFDPKQGMVLVLERKKP